MQTILIAASNKLLLSTKNSKRKIIHGILNSLKVNFQFLEMAVHFLNSSKCFVSVEGGILLAVHREDPVSLCRTGVGEGRGLFMCVGNKGP